jgi:hypothetical protein
MESAVIVTVFWVERTAAVFLAYWAAAMIVGHVRTTIGTVHIIPLSLSAPNPKVRSELVGVRYQRLQYCRAQAALSLPIVVLSSSMSFSVRM